MAETITAIYEQGVLRPLTPLDLPEHSQVEIEVRPITRALDVDARREQAWAALEAAGILAPITPPTRSPMTDAERRKLAERVAASGGTPLSQIIIEEREEQL